MHDQIIQENATMSSEDSIQDILASTLAEFTPGDIQDMRNFIDPPPAPKIREIILVDNIDTADIDLDKVREEYTRAAAASANTAAEAPKVETVRPSNIVTDKTMEDFYRAMKAALVPKVDTADIEAGLVNTATRSDTRDSPIDLTDYIRSARTYKYLVDNKDNNKKGRPQHEVLEHNERFTKDDPKLIVYNEADYSYTVFNSVDHYLQCFHGIPESARTFHEVIRGDAAQKLRFDIDASSEDLAKAKLIELFDEEDFYCYEAGTSAEVIQRSFLFRTVLRAVSDGFYYQYGDYLPIDQFIIADSSDSAKFSRHIIINEFAVANHLEAREFAQKVVSFLPKCVAKFVDMGVYKSNQNFRLPECHKVGSARVKKLLNGAVDADAIITNTAGCKMLPRVCKAAVQLCDDVVVDCKEAEVIAMAAPFTEGHEFKSRKGNRFNYRRRRPSMCSLCERTHDNDNTAYVTVSASGNVYLHCYKQPKGGESTLIGTINVANVAAASTVEARAPYSLKKYLKFARKHMNMNVEDIDKIPEEFTVTKYELPEVAPYPLHQFDTLVVKSIMGTGKSVRLRESIQAINLSTRVIVVSFRRSFTSEIMSKLPGFVDYRVTQGELGQNRLVVQYESLHRVKLHSADSKCLLVLDESESILTQVENRPKIKRKMLKQCWMKFEWLMRYSTKVIAMDALAGVRTFELLRRTRKQVHALINTYKPPAAAAPKDIHYANEEDFDKQVFDAAEFAAEEPMVVTSNSLKKAKFIEKNCRRRNPAAVIKMYSSESTPDERKDFEDVNTAWQDVDILIYTSTVSAGCSFEIPRFHRLFAYFTPRSTDYITAVQMMGRVRNLETREYHIYVKNDPRDVPTTFAGVESILKTVNGVATLTAAGINNSLDGAVTYLNALGEEEFALKDLEYYTHIGNMLHKCLSQRYFHPLLMKAREDMGAVVTIIDKCEQEPEVVAEMRAQKKEIMQEIAVESMERLLSAPVPRDEEVDGLQNSDQLTPEEIRGLHMYNLADDYGVDVDKIDAAFLKKFDNPRVRTAWHNLNRFARFGGDNLVDSANKFIEVNKLDENAKTLEHNPGNAELLKLLTGLDVVNIVFDNVCRDVNRFVMRYIHRAVLTEKMQKVIRHMKPHMATYKYLFGARVANEGNLEKANLQRHLKFINPILGNAFDMKISLDLKDRNMFYLQPTGNFIYDVETNCWRPRI